MASNNNKAIKEIKVKQAAMQSSGGHAAVQLVKNAWDTLRHNYN